MNMNMNIFNQINEFKKMLGNQNPQELLDSLLKSGKVTQEQVDEARKKAESLMGLFK